MPAEAVIERSAPQEDYTFHKGQLLLKMQALFSTVQ